MRDVPDQTRDELASRAALTARVWELRENVTCYDGWYVAVAELLDAPLATLDGLLANSPGPRCQFSCCHQPRHEPHHDLVAPSVMPNGAAIHRRASWRGRSG